MSVRHCAATTAPCNCWPNCYAEQSHKDNVRSSAVGKQLKQKKSNSQALLHLPALDQRGSRWLPVKECIDHKILSLAYNLQPRHFTVSSSTDSSLMNLCDNFDHLLRHVLASEAWMQTIPKSGLASGLSPTLPLVIPALRH